MSDTDEPAGVDSETADSETADSETGGSETADNAAVPREVIEPVVREVVEEELTRYRRQVAVVVAAVVGGGLMIAFAIGMAGVALLAPEPETVLVVLGVLGALLFAGGVITLVRETG